MYKNLQIYANRKILEHKYTTNIWTITVSILGFFSWTERPIDSKLGRKYQG